jgi:hypothetical protein
VKNIRKRATIALALAAAMLAAWLGVARAQNGAEKTIRLRLRSVDFSPAEVLLPGEALRLEVLAQADFPVYSNFTIIYYDSRYFAPALGDGSAFAAPVWGGEEQPPGQRITEYLADCGALEALCGAGAHGLVGDLNVTNPLDYPDAWKDGAGGLLPGYESYAALAVKAPCDPVGEPAPLGLESEPALFSFYLKAIAPTPEGATADVFFAQDALRGPRNPNGPMAYYASAAGRGAVGIEVSPPLRFTVEPPAQDPVRVAFSAGSHGRIISEFTAVRNIPGAPPSPGRWRAGGPPSRRTRATPCWAGPTRRAPANLSCRGRRS